jgi:hypothetical protein
MPIGLTEFTYLAKAALEANDFDDNYQSGTRDDIW